MSVTLYCVVLCSHDISDVSSVTYGNGAFHQVTCYSRPRESVKKPKHDLNKSPKLTSSVFKGVFTTSKDNI